MSGFCLEGDHGLVRDGSVILRASPFGAEIVQMTMRSTDEAFYNIEFS